MFGFVKGFQFYASQALAAQSDPAVVAPVAARRKLKTVGALETETLVSVARRSDTTEHGALVKELQSLAVQMLAGKSYRMTAQICVMCPKRHQCCDRQ